jgi:predicted CoA-substrate-specific enzyme activase
MKTLGICFGSTSMQCVIVNHRDNNTIVEKTFRKAHEGNPRKELIEFLRGIEHQQIDRIAVTGRAFRNHVYLTSIPEPEAIECALRSVYCDTGFPDMVISSGGETQLVYTINKNGGISAVHSGNKCASGTGEFFLQQIRRMGLSLEEAVELASKGEPHKIAGRCSVFCKSDCTHALNKGESRANVAAGLCLMMADKISDLVKDIPCEFATLIGGGSLNKAMVALLEKRFPRFSVPLHADCFEAFGAAMWALEHDCLLPPSDIPTVIKGNHNSFGNHKALKDAMGLVDFRKSDRGIAADGDCCILGLDVGSTTTKAVLMRTGDAAILASVYLRTNGDPVQAARNCYTSLREQIGNISVTISGLGVTGSGRQIAGLHALTNNVINEIIAHATAAAHFDKDVDTIFEIGGQDAKYTLLTNGVPSDYAMNEACSAGTGSFLEESAKESLNVSTEEIGALALDGTAPPNFTDQCAAFISSDIKIAGQEGIGKNDILAGLVYSICLNYVNRVKGSRPVGKKIFMQGGVCYNKAVPVAMASLMNTQIIVPPDPGLMGAFGVALEVKNRVALGIANEEHYDLDELIQRDALRDGSFTCAGGKEKCDRKCEISRIKINGKMYPFGGVCNRYYNLRLNREVNTEEFDLVAIREKLLFEKYGVKPFSSVTDLDKPAKTVGLIRSFLTHTFYPLYSNFFNKLGFNIVFPDEIDPEGISRIEAAFCLPAELAHGSFYSLLKKNPDYIFLPQVALIPVTNPSSYTKTCVFVQAEPYYLKATFRKELENSPIVVLSPVLKMDKGYEAEEAQMVDIAKSMGVSEKIAMSAFEFACKQQRALDEELQKTGKKALDYLSKHKDTFGIVLFGRPYNSFTSDANMGIPHKVASRGYMIIPHDMIPSAEYMASDNMFWGMGQKIMKSAQYVKDKENLFGFYITNFSCGPDSFLLGFFRKCMGQKPSLTLELDQHTADAGIDTRIEAAVDIMTSYRRIGSPQMAPSAFVPAKIVMYGKDIRVRASDGNDYPLNDPKIEVLIPSMGRLSAEAVASVMKGMGIDARALPVADKDVLLEGRKNSTCKECLPFILTTGAYVSYLKARKNNKISVFFMATGGGPCRLGQYCTALNNLIETNKFRDTAVLPMTDETGYGGMGARMLLRSWQAILISDVLYDIRSTLAVVAVDKDSALAEVEILWREVKAYLEGTLSVRLTSLLASIAQRLSKIPIKKSPDDIPVISLIGEIYVRKDEFSRKNLVDYLENQGFMVRVAPISEFMHYSNYVVNNNLGERQFNLKDQFKMHLTAQIQEWWERRIKSIFAESKLYNFEMIEVDKTIRAIPHLISEHFRGETILTIGLGLREILHDSCGVVSIGPFGCMPARVSEAILKKEMNVEGKKRLPGWDKKAESYRDIENFPFLSIETDGSPFPQLIEANLEAFVLQAKRLHNKMMEIRRKHQGKKHQKKTSLKWYDIVLGNGPLFSGKKSKEKEKLK